MKDSDSDETRRFMDFLNRNASEIRDEWPRWKADAFRLVHRIKPLDHEQFEVRLEVPTYVVLTMDRVQKMTDEELLTSTERARVEMEARKTELYGYMLWSARENERLQELFVQRTMAQKMFAIHLDELKRRNKK